MSFAEVILLTTEMPTPKGYTTLAPDVRTTGTIIIYSMLISLKMLKSIDSPEQRLHCQCPCRWVTLRKKGPKGCAEPLSGQRSPERVASMSPSLMTHHHNSYASG